MQNLWISSIFISFAPSKESLFQHVNIPSLVLADETQNIIVPARDDHSFCCRILRNIKICRGCRNPNGAVLGDNLSSFGCCILFARRTFHENHTSPVSKYNPGFTLSSGSILDYFTPCICDLLSYHHHVGSRAPSIGTDLRYSQALPEREITTRSAVLRAGYVINNQDGGHLRFTSGSASEVRTLCNDRKTRPRNLCNCVQGI